MGMRRFELGQIYRTGADFPREIWGILNTYVYGFSGEIHEFYRVRNPIALIAVVFLSFTSLQCGAQSNYPPPTKPAMEKKNPVYSNTDTNKVNLSVEEWQKILMWLAEFLRTHWKGKYHLHPRS